jgi:VWFA-related protein
MLPAAAFGSQNASHKWRLESMRRLGLVAGLLCILIAPVIAAQLKVDVALVNVVATITDHSGHYVPDLTEDDLIVYEDGQLQKIAHFSQSNDLPVSIGVLLDTSGSMERKIGTATTAVERFLRSIQKDDDIFLMTFANRPDLRQDFTDDRERLAKALRRVSVGGGTALYDALDEGLRKIKHGKHDKRAILLITDGEDTSSDMNLEEVQSRVRESELLVYCLGISPTGGVLTERNPGPSPNPGPFPGGRRGPSIGFPFPGIPGIPGIPGGPFPGRYPVTPAAPRQYPGGRNRGNPNEDTVDMDVLESFADASGGKAWLVSGGSSENRGNEIQDALDEIAAELRNQYSIGYYPDHPLNDGKWHRIGIEAKDRRYRVRTRKEYFGK